MKKKQLRRRLRWAELEADKLSRGLDDLRAAAERVCAVDIDDDVKLIEAIALLRHELPLKIDRFVEYWSVPE